MSVQAENGAQMKCIYALVLAVIVSAVLPAMVWAQEQEEFEQVPPDVVQGQTAAPKPKINNLPFNMYGLSGLMVTTATRTLDPGSFEVGLGGIYEDSPNPKAQYYRGAGQLMMTVGMPSHFEFGLKVPYVFTDLDVTWRASRARRYEMIRFYDRDPVSGLGSIEGMFKWGFVQQKNFLPAFALGFGGVAPGSTYIEGGGGTGDVKTYGVKILLAMGLELNDLPFTDYAFAILADGVLYLRDVLIEDRDYEEKSGLVHAGMIFPLHPRNFLELMLEYEGELMRGTTNEQDINSVLLSLRFVHHHFNVSAGAKYSFKADPDFDDAFSYLGTFSYKYF
jgi:hypothetical protein